MSMQIDFTGMGNAELLLLLELERLVRANRSCCAKLVLHLAEVDARRLYREQAYSCLFEYCVRALRMSESEAYLRIFAARCSRRYPILIELLEAGELNLTSIKLIGPHLTQANHLRVLDRVRGKSKREVEQLVAELAPQPDVAASLRRLPERSRRGRAAAATALATERLALGKLPLAAAAAPVTDSPAAPSVESIAAALVSGSPAVAASIESITAAPVTDSPLAAASVESIAAASVSGSGAAAPSIEPRAADLPGMTTLNIAPPSAAKPAFALTPPRRAATRALSPGRFKLVLTLDQEQHDKLEQLRELLRHQIPDGDLAPIVNLAISELLEKKRQQRFAQPRTARKGQTAPRKQRDASRPRQGPPDRDSPRMDAQPRGASPEGDAQLRDATLGRAGTQERDTASDRGGSQVRDATLGRAGTQERDTASDRGGTQERDATLGRGGTQERDATLGLAGTQEHGTALDRGGPQRRDAARGRGRYIPREVVRAVFARDLGRCTFVGDNGQRCDARGFLELHHHGVTYARGGEASVENLRLMCRCHNSLLAERDYGARYMEWRVSSAISDRAASANGEPSLL
jgi:hypothetical protein